MDKKFLGSLFGKKAEPEDRYVIELARANSALAARSHIGRAQITEPPPEPEGQLTVDIYQTPDDIVVQSAIAGVRPEDIDINVTPDSIVIRGLRHREVVDKEHDYLYQECYWGRFARSVILPEEVDPESADVTFKNGILTVRLPKANRKKMRKLKVRVD
ncbi:MAG: Hsp20/alpha crystallin family protein [Minisyncoccia bacterium]|jgi:HSP20 family protein